MLVGIHIAHRHQRAVFQRQRSGIMGAGMHAGLGGGIGQQLAQRRIARVGVGQVLDEVRQFVGGVDPFKRRGAIDVVAGIHQPVGVEHHDGVHPQFTAAAADFLVAIDGGLTAALMLAGQFG